MYTLIRSEVRVDRYHTQTLTDLKKAHKWPLELSDEHSALILAPKMKRNLVASSSTRMNSSRTCAPRPEFVTCRIDFGTKTCAHQPATVHQYVHQLTKRLCALNERRTTLANCSRTVHQPSRASSSRASVAIDREPRTVLQTLAASVRGLTATRTLRAATRFGAKNAATVSNHDRHRLRSSSK